MSYSTVSHVAHESYPPPQGGYPGVLPPPPPPPPPRPGFEQGYASGPGPGPGYQSYFSDNYPPQVSHMHYSGPTGPFQQPYGGYQYHSNDNGLSSLLRAAMAALCCCCFLEQCCNFW